MKYFSTLNPYPQMSVLTSQFIWGDAYAKYGTNISNNDKVAIAQPYWNPLACQTSMPKNARNSRTFDCSMSGSGQTQDLSAVFSTNSFQEVLFKTSLHLFNALNYDYLKVYVIDKSPSLFSWHQVLSMLIVFFGFYLVLKKHLSRTATAFDLFLDGIIVVTLGVCLFFGVGTRFGLLATMVLSIKAVECSIFYRPEGNEAIPLMFGAIMFIAMSSLLSIYVLSYSGALSS